MHLAARFAAKEAVLKALRTGLSCGITWTDVEVVREADGCPVVRLHNVASEVAQAKGITSWQLSLTHTDDLAFASAIAISG